MEEPSPPGEKPFREIFLANWIPALLTAVLAGLVAAYFVPFASNHFETGRLFQERRTRVLESTADAFAGAVADFGKIRALEKEVSAAHTTLAALEKGDPQLRRRLDEKVDRWRKELRDTEIALYAVTQKLQANLTLAKLLFTDADTTRALQQFFAWWRAQTKPIHADEFRDQATRVMEAMVKEMRK